MQKFSVGGPLITVGTSSPVGDVANINLNIYADGETPAGYTPPQLYSYIPAPGGKYATSDINTSGDSIGMSFGLPGSASGSTSIVLDQTKAQIAFKYLDGYTGSTPNFDAHPLVINLASSGSLNSIWQNWQVVAPGGAIPSYAGGGTNTNAWYIIEPTGNAQPEGSILLLGSLPVLSSGVGWYKIDVGGTGVATKTFNLYTTTTNTPAPGQFVNTASAQAIDGGASIALQNNGQATAPTFNINFLSGSATDIDGSLLAMTLQSVPTIRQPWFPSPVRSQRYFIRFYRPADVPVIRWPSAG